jgi:transposase
MRVKTDRHDARGIAQLVRLGWFKRVHVKSLDAQETRALLTARTFLVEKVTATENALRAALRNFGLKMGSVTRKTWEARARELAAGNTVLEGIVEAMLRVRSLLLEELAKVDGQLTALAKSDPVTRLLMTTPGVGVIVALTFRSAVDDPDRFPRGRDVGAWAGLTPRRWQSGKTDIAGRITKAGDPRVRVMLFEAACRASSGGRGSCRP